MNKVVCLFGVLLSCVAFADDEPGHSSHGSAFDSGMRLKPWPMPGIGDTPFPITTTNPEVQKWFNQGEALLHSFWFEEAERTFRWCLKLEPGSAMAYWGLARCGFTWFNLDNGSFNDKEFGRYKTFLKEAVKRKDKVTERERMYIEALDSAVAKGGSETYNAKLRDIIAKFPDDIEAKSLLALFSIGRIKQDEDENIVQEVLKVNPLHPGALHASIHNWDEGSPTKAIKSSQLYGTAAPKVGHALHMPGHIFSKVGLWHEAAIAMDSATRTELKYMNERLALPFETWNFSHNRNYLCYIQEELGMANASIKGGRDLLTAPREPEKVGRRGDEVSQGMRALFRSLVKFQRAKEILTPGFAEWDEGDQGKKNQLFAETMAYLWSKNLSKAAASFDKLKSAYGKDGHSIYLSLAEGYLRLAQGRTDEGEKALLAADEEEKKHHGSWANDPPNQPWTVARLMGDYYREKGFPSTAISYYERALEYEPNAGFSLGGMALALKAKGDQTKANEFAGKFFYEWSNADSDLPLVQQMKAAFPDVKPKGDTQAPEREYRPNDLKSFGPSNWEPYQAPKLEVKNVDGKGVRLSDYRGKNVLLVFFLNDACVHCVGQLKSINDRIKEFQDQNAVVLGVCSQSPKAIKESSTLNPVKLTYLSDTNHENARRYASYDDFEEMELHSTILIDAKGNIRWKRTGGDPFTNIDFLLKELKRINKG